jgi:hypothetical protein
VLRRTLLSGVAADQAGHLRGAQAPRAQDRQAWGSSLRPVLAGSAYLGRGLFCAAVGPHGGCRWRAGSGAVSLGAAAISVTTAAGVLTLLTKSNWWSYAMAAGFITALLTYGSILAQPEPRGRRPGDLPSARA